MKIPKKVKILGRVIKIKFDDGLQDMGYAGLYDPTTYTIFLNPDSNDIERDFWHEVGHAVIHRSGLNQIVSRDAEEMVVETFSNVICELILGKK